MAKQKKVFKGQSDLDLINMLLKLPLEQRKKEIRQCELTSLRAPWKAFQIGRLKKLPVLYPLLSAKNSFEWSKFIKAKLLFPKKPFDDTG